MQHSLDITDKNKTQAVSANSLNEKTIQNKAIALEDNRPASILQKKANNTGLPDQLKSGIENLSGHSMDDVKVHYNSGKPGKLNAHAYAQGTDIHIASGQEKHLPHEAWHVVQQKQGRVRPTLQMKGKVNVNDDQGLEREADVMGAKALQTVSATQKPLIKASSSNAVQRVVQRLKIPFSYTQFLNGNAASKDSVKSYFHDYIQMDYGRANAPDIKGQMEETDEFKAMTASYFAYAKAYFTAEQSDNWSAMPALLDTLAANINAVLAYAKDTLGVNLQKYSNKNADSWSNANHALTSLSKISPLPSLVPMHPGGAGTIHPSISVIPWSVARTKIPSALHHLLRDIYTSWRLGLVMDERDDASRTAKEKNSNTPGALRSWHMNEQKQLPENNATNLPAHATALHAHYVAHSKHPYVKDSQLATHAGPKAPIGYAEYTGTGIMDDFHYSKIVLNYKTGFIYLTVTHYGLWNKKENGQHEIKDKTAGSGTLSAWFGISMTT